MQQQSNKASKYLTQEMAVVFLNLREPVPNICLLPCIKCIPNECVLQEELIRKQRGNTRIDRYVGHYGRIVVELKMSTQRMS